MSIVTCFKVHFYALFCLLWSDLLQTTNSTDIIRHKLIYTHKDSNAIIIHEAAKSHSLQTLKLTTQDSSIQWENTKNEHSTESYACQHIFTSDAHNTIYSNLPVTMHLTNVHVMTTALAATTN